MRTCTAAFALLLAGALIPGAPAAEPDKPADAPAPQVDAEKIKALVAMLASEAYQERVQATKDLGAMPAEALPVIEEEGKKWRTDPEVAARIAEVRQNMGLKVLKTKDEVLAYLHKRFEAAARDGRLETARSVLKESLEKLKDLTPAKEWHATQAKVYDDAGRFYYKAGQAGQRKAFMEEAEKMLGRANDSYEEALKAEPSNKDLENAQVECNMLLYASRKYQDLQRIP